MLEAAWESGIRYFDTAPHYGLGLSERRLGAFLATKPRADYVVSTKVGRLLRPSAETANLLDDANQFAVPTSLRRCGTSAPAASGRASRSPWSASASRGRRSLPARSGRARPGQRPVDRRPGAGRAPRRGARHRHRDRLEVDRGAGRRGAHRSARPRHGRRALHAARAGGGGGRGLPRDRGRRSSRRRSSTPALLSTPRPRRPVRVRRGATRAARARAAHRRRSASGTGSTLPEAALQFPLREPAVRSVVVGAATPEQIRENARRMEAEIPEALWDELDAR